MGVYLKFVVIPFLAVFLEAQSQNFGYGYQPINSYQGYQGSQSYTPYPYSSGQYYGNYVSNVPSYYRYFFPTNYYPYQQPYYDPQQYSGYSSPVFPPSGGGYSPSYGSPSSYPFYQPYGYPANAQVSTDNRTSGDTGYSPTISAPGTGYPYSFYPYYGYPSSPLNISGNETDLDPYANITTEIIDVDPRYFHYYKRFFNLQDEVYPSNTVDEPAAEEVTPTGRRSHQPQYSYTVKSESKSSNFSSPLSVHKHDVKTKTFSFKKTFTLDPSNKEGAVVNLNFVNGVQVTDAPEITTVGIVPAEEEEEEDEETEDTEADEPEMDNTL